MCHADGMIFDDGTVLRLAEDRFFTTTTTGNAAAVLDWMPKATDRLKATSSMAVLRVHKSTALDTFIDFPIHGLESVC